MANSIAILQKMARNATMLGQTVVSQSQTAVVIANGSNNLTISYAAAVFSPPVVGGVDDTISPFLGIGVGNPGQLVLQSASGTSVATVIDGAIAAQVLCMLAALANDIIIANNTTLGAPSIPADQLARIRGQSDIIGLGQ
jgi:hypothetical protein